MGGVKHGEGFSGGANQHMGHTAGVKHAEGPKHVKGVRQGCQSLLG